MRHIFRLAVLTASLACTTTLAPLSAAQADVVISSAATQDMSCSGGVCAPTAANAVLNAGDLQTMLASGNVTVTTTGSGVQADNIDVKAKFSWSGAYALTLDAFQSITVFQHVSVAGQGGLTLITNDGGSGGTFSTRPRGRVSFANLSSSLSINGKAYTLVGNIKTLAGDIAANATGDYALADDYDASQDGIYSNTPVTTFLTGAVEGLGNTISNIDVDVPKSTEFNAGGLFLVVDSGGIVENFNLAALKLMMGSNDVSENVGGLTDTNKGLLFNDHVSGSIYVDAEKSGGGSGVGGLVSYNYQGTIANSSSAVDIDGRGILAGGLVGGNVALIAESFAMGSVKSSGHVTYGGGGGLADGNSGIIENSYSTGAVLGKGFGSAGVGGFIAGGNYPQSVATSYSTGKVTANADSPLGGFMGQDLGGSTTNCYWDTTTSGTDEGTGEGNVPGITGLRSKQLRKGLPAGFDPTIWAEDPKINNGFPYLIDNPPPEK